MAASSKVLPTFYAQRGFEKDLFLLTFEFFSQPMSSIQKLRRFLPVPQAVCKGAEK